MNQNRLSIALPCKNFNDFPIKLSSEQAKSLLKCWTALWHPLLLSEFKSRPDIWSAQDHVNESVQGQSPHLVAVPMLEGIDFGGLDPSVDSILNFVFDSASQTRDQFAESMKVASKQVESDLRPHPHAEQLALIHDFYALGYAWLQVRLMTLHVRYSTNLDDELFDSMLIEAATAWSGDDQTESNQRLLRCYDLILEERNSYYSVEPQLLDLTILERSTLGINLAEQLKCKQPINVLLTGQVATVLAKDYPVNANALKRRLGDGTAALVGGIQRELVTSLIPIESQLRQFVRGRSVLETLLDSIPKVYARRKFGLSSMTPGLLEQLSYHGACHMSLDGGKLPDVHGSNMRWVGDDAQTIPALATVPVDANDSGNFLSLGIKIAKQIDAEHASTLVFAHWPNQQCSSYADLLAIAKYGALFGEFVCFDDYFESAYDPGYGESFSAEQYEPPGLRRAIKNETVNPISRFVTYWRNNQRLVALRSLMTMAAFLTSDNDFQAIGRVKEWQRSIEEIEDLIDDFVYESEPGAVQTSTGEVTNAIDELTDVIANQIVGVSASAQGSFPGQCIINPHTFSTGVCLPSGSVAELPATGWNIISADRDQQLLNRMAGPAVDDGLTLRNEYFRINVDPRSGGIRSLQSYDTRQTRASQRLSIRISKETSIVYAEMVADDVTIERISRSESRIVSTGGLQHPQTQESICRFSQVLTVHRKIPVANLEIEIIDFDIGPEAIEPEAVNHQVCSRLAWQEESATICYGSPEIRSDSHSATMLAPSYIRIEQFDHPVTLFTGGLPWHLRSSRNRIDSILIAGNERCRKFRMGLAIDCQYDLQAAIGWTHEPIRLSASLRRDATSGWMFHFSSKNIIATSCEPIVRGGFVAGVRWRFLETQGRRGKLAITCPFPIAGAQRKVFDGSDSESLQFEGKVVRLDFTRNEYFEIEVSRDR